MPHLRLLLAILAAFIAHPAAAQSPDPVAIDWDRAEDQVAFCERDRLAHQGDWACILQLAAPDATAPTLQLGCGCRVPAAGRAPRTARMMRAVAVEDQAQPRRPHVFAFSVDGAEPVEFAFAEREDPLLGVAMTMQRTAEQTPRWLAVLQTMAGGARLAIAGAVVERDGRREVWQRMIDLAEGRAALTRFHALCAVPDPCR